MSTNSVVHALYDDDDVLMDAVKMIRKGEIYIEEVFTPFPVHGLDKAMGIKPTRLAIASFIYGLIGLLFSVWMTNYMMIEDWPQDIGGKPNFTWWLNMPAFLPIIFEMTVFFAAHLMVITFYMRSRIWPFKEAENPDPRTTDDIFLVEIPIDGNKEKLLDLLEKTSPVEIRVIEKE